MWLQKDRRWPRPQQTEGCSCPKVVEQVSRAGARVTPRPLGAAASRAWVVLRSPGQPHNAHKALGMASGPRCVPSTAGAVVHLAPPMGRHWACSWGHGGELKQRPWPQGRQKKPE